MGKAKAFAGAGAVLAICATGVYVTVQSAAIAAPARAARSFTVNETGHLRLTSHKGFTLNEQGTASGTIRGPIYVHLHVVSTNRVTAEVSIYPNGSSLTGSASGSYHAAGATATFNGTMSIVRGSGAYTHAKGSGLRFTGSIARSNDAMTVHLSGTFST